MWYCYILRCIDEGYTNRTYNGSTNNVLRRLKDHHSKTRGAKYTRGKNWELYALLSGFTDDMYHNALQCEWRIKCPNNKKRRGSQSSGPLGRLKGLNEVLKLPRWTNNSTLDNKDCQFTLYLLEDMKDYSCSDLPENIKVVIVHNILETITNEEKNEKINIIDN